MSSLFLNYLHMRQIFLDTETTGFDYQIDDRLIELGCVEMVNRELTGNNLHMYFKVDKESNPDALRVHGITSEFLADKPTFENCVDEIIEYLSGAEILAHNAKFDVNFLNAELQRLKKPKVEDIAAKITDTLAMAKELYIGKRNSLDALCERLEISNDHRVFHGALLDADLLAQVWLAMTRGQFGLDISSSPLVADVEVSHTKNRMRNLIVRAASEEELLAHQAYLQAIQAPQEW